MEDEEHPEWQQVEALVKEFVAKLGEHCDMVRIFVAFPSPVQEKTTCTYTHGTGSWFATYGQIKHWVIREEAEVEKEAWGESED